MKNPTQMFPGFHLATLRKKPRSSSQQLADKLNHIKSKTFSQLGECLGKFIPRQHLQPAVTGLSSRRRIFSKENTFWAFLSQIMDADGGCLEVVRKLQAYAAIKSTALPSSSTSAYCQARKKLELSSLEAILQHTSRHHQSLEGTGLLNGRHVIVVDGTGVSMPDTEENQKRWPQQKHQKPGCGFPQASICACFSLQTGGLLSDEIGNKKSHELPMLRKQWDTFKKGDIFLGDKAFCSFFDINSFNVRGIDSIVTLARRPPATEHTAVRILGENDVLLQWSKPMRSKKSSYSIEDWEGMPEQLTLRQIKVDVQNAGFRVKTFYIITTLLDPEQYPASKIAELYLRRWDVELFFGDIKTTMGMDILRCKIPERVHKEIVMHFIAYNCIRSLVAEAADENDLRVHRISFKGSVQALRQWEPHLNQTKMSKQECIHLIKLLHESIASNVVPERRGRSEPRAVKRRPKPFPLLTVARHEMKQALLSAK